MPILKETIPYHYNSTGPPVSGKNIYNDTAVSEGVSKMQIQSQTSQHHQHQQSHPPAATKEAKYKDTFDFEIVEQLISEDRMDSGTQQQQPQTGSSHSIGIGPPNQQSLQQGHQQSSVPGMLTNNFCFSLSWVIGKSSSSEK